MAYDQLTKGAERDASNGSAVRFFYGSKTPVITFFAKYLTINFGADIISNDRGDVA